MINLELSEILKDAGNKSIIIYKYFQTIIIINNYLSQIIATMAKQYLKIIKLPIQFHLGTSYYPSIRLQTLKIIFSL